MCGRYYVDADEQEMRAMIMEVEKAARVATGEVYPTNTAAVLSPSGTLCAMHWGFPLYGGKGELINARSETAAEKYMFRRSYRTGRCLIPASRYFEWEKRGAAKVKYAFRAQERVTWLAGLSAYDDKAGIYRFVILTRPVWEAIAFIHDRMPVILPQALHDEWLNGHTPAEVIARATDAVVYAEA